MTEKQMLLQMLKEQYTDAHFDALLQIMDRLHDAATANELKSVTPMDTRDVIGWLDDIIYTAEETIREIERNLPGAPNANEDYGWSYKESDN